MTLLERIARQRTDDVVYSVIALTIEKIAAEAARELLKDASFKAELKALAQHSVARSVRSLRNGAPRRRKRGRR